MLISKACTEWCWSTHTLEVQNWYALRSSKLQVNAEFKDNYSLAVWRSATLSFKTGMDATLLNYMCLGVWGPLEAKLWKAKLVYTWFFFHLYFSPNSDMIYLNMFKSSTIYIAFKCACRFYHYILIVFWGGYIYPDMFCIFVYNLPGKAYLSWSNRWTFWSYQWKFWNYQ